MASATTIRFSKFRVLLSDAASPEVFAAPCGFTSRALNRSKNLGETAIPDCDDEDAPSWVGRDVISNTWGVTGEGVLAEESYSDWQDFFDSDVSRNLEIEIELPGGTLTYAGAAHLSTFNVAGTRGEGRVTVNVELAGDGALIQSSP